MLPGFSRGLDRQRVQLHAKVHRRMRSDDVGIRSVFLCGTHLVWTISSLQLLDFVDLVTTKNMEANTTHSYSTELKETHLQPNLTRILSSFCWTHLSERQLPALDEPCSVRKLFIE